MRAPAGDGDSNLSPREKPSGRLEKVPPVGDEKRSYFLCVVSHVGLDKESSSKGTETWYYSATSTPCVIR